MQNNEYQITGGHLASLEIGDVDLSTVTVLFLHGWLDNAASFSTLMESIHSQLPNLHLCAVDLPGHGLSFHKAAGNYYLFHDYIDDIYQLISTHFSHRRVVLAGHSLGALIASCVSSAFPELITALVQIEGAGPLPEQASHAVERLRAGIVNRSKLKDKPIRHYESLEQATSLRAKVNRLLPDQIEPIVLRGMKKQGSEYIWRHDPKLQCESIYRMSFEHADEIVKNIKSLHLIVLGEDGYPELRQRLSQLSNLKYEVRTVAGGHHCHLENSHAVALSILGLVNKI
ncbi:alpha/beta hydrolase [Vibrio sinus]|uniref:alpha/beta hydrolase n=1 Tax=Vibrio sinus TaxID=2946865 RepID=UPI003D6F0938